MNVYFITVLYVISDFVVLLQCTTNTETKEDQPLASLSASEFAPPMDNWEMNPDLKSLWVYRPPPIQQSHQNDEQLSHRVVLRSPHIITKVAKPFPGLNSFFRKTYFEPFERRQKPVTLIAFRKNGILPRKAVDPSNLMSSEIAELQSPFNEISSFWQDDTHLLNL